jgi:hypothetical protein
MTTYIPSTGGTYRWSWRRFMCVWLGLRMNVPPRLGRLELVMEVSNNLVDLGTLPIRDILELPKMAQEVLAVASLILECLREENASDADPSD